MPQVGNNARLVTAPPYRWIRHPMYTGQLVFCVGLVMTDAAAGGVSFVKIAGWLILAVTLDLKARIEERHLLETFREYAAYREQTWRFVPGLY